MSGADPDVLVVGAGPSGLALALQAHDHGARVRVVERRAEAFRPSRALIVHPRTLEVLRPLGVTPALLDRGDVAPAVRLHLGRREVPLRIGPFDIVDTPFPYLVFEPQAAVEEVLARALADRGVEVERGVELVGVRSGASGPTEARLARAGAAETVSCRFVAGCDGSASTVRSLAGLGFRGGAYAQEVVLADLELDGDLDLDSAHAVAGANGLLFLFDIGERATWRLLATRPRGAGPGVPGRPEGEVPVGELQALIDDAGLAARVREVAWSARVELHHRLATGYRRGPLFLVGEAAHVHSPAGGQGMNMGIQDAANLGWKLAFAASGGRGPEGLAPLLDSYERERRRVARQVLAMTHLLFWAEASTHPVARIARGRLGPLAAPVLPHLLRARRPMAEGVRVLSQLRVRYRGSPLSLEGAPSGSGGPRAGDRMPDGTVQVTGGRRQLHDLLAAPGVAILLDRDAPWPPRRALGPLVRVHRILDRAGVGVRVVRPDGHLGFRSAGAPWDQVLAWLELVAAPTGPRLSR